MILGNTTGQVAGWGINAISNRPSTILMHTSMPTVTNDNCWSTFELAAEAFNFVIHDKPLSENKFCAGDP